MHYIIRLSMAVTHILVVIRLAIHAMKERAIAIIAKVNGTTPAGL